MEENNDAHTSNSNLNTYCTLRPSSSRNNNDRLKKINQIGGSLRRIREFVDSARDNENTSCSYPYNQLEESLFEPFNNEISNESIIDHDHLAVSITNDNSNKSIDLINLNTSTAVANDNNANTNNHSNQSLEVLNDNNDLVPLSKLIINGDRQSFSEFKRLNSYCTLRPDQKRKYLMKILSSAKKSANTLTNCDNNSKTTNELLFTELDHVENCLLELDAYLEEIDSKSSLSDNLLFETLPSCSSSFPSSSQSSSSSTAAIITVDNTTIDNNLSRPCHKNTNKSNNNKPMTVLSDININSAICDGELNSQDLLTTTFQRNNSSRLMTELRPELSWKISSTMPRDYKATSISSAAIANNGTNFTNSSNNPHRNMLYRRDSMRKVNPLILPDAVIPPQNQSLQESTSIDNSVNNDEFTNQMITDTHRMVMSSSSNSSSTTTTPSLNNDTDSSVVSMQNNNDDDDIGIEYLNLFTQEQLERSQQEQLQHREMESQTTDFIGDDNNNNNNEQCSTINSNNNRPRQMGRRAEGCIRIVSITTESDTTGNQRIYVNHDRPTSAPARAASRNAQHLQQQQQQQQYNIPSEPSSVNTTRNTSPVSIISSSTSISSTAESVINNSTDLQHRSNHFGVSHERPTISQPGHISSQSTAATGMTSTNEQDETTEKEKLWPYSFSRILTATNCTLGLFNISRFSIFSIHFGANFIVQFIILSIIFGIPMLWLQMCLGFNLKRGPIAMWRITPICKGVGIAILVIQAICAMYSAVSIGWLLVYFRDSFVSRDSRYRWQEPFPIFRGGGSVNGQTQIAFATNDSSNLVETVADYFNGVVLQRYQLGPAGGLSNGLGAVRFQLAFNLAVTWIIVFAILCEGLRSYGKIVFILMILPMIGLASLCTKMLTMINSSSLQNIFPSTDWQDFFINSQSWSSAAQEVFLTWVLLGASIISIFSKSMNLNEKKMVLRRDAIIVCFITVLGLIFSAILGNACVQILNDNGYFYFPGSFENLNSYGFLIPSNGPLPAQLLSTPMKWLPRYSSLLGESYRRMDLNPNKESGFQPIRLVTELFPATLAAASQENIGAVWSVLGYLVFIAFAIGQLCAMWKPIAEALGNSMSGVLLSCVSGLLLAIPLASECGINIIHFLDYIFGGSWCMILLWVSHIFAIFLIRGRPYTGDILVNDLQLTHTLAAFVALSWNVLLPIGLITLCILEYKMSGSRDLYHWRGKTYWSMWIRKVGVFLQIGCLMIVPITAAIQIYRYLSNGPPDILDRIQLLYRPSVPLAHGRNSMTNNRYASDRITVDRTRHQLNATGSNGNGVSFPATITIASNGNGGIVGGSNGNSNLQDRNNEDAPPKYTPPPSYTTATGARIAKMLRNSIRRSVRRIMGESSSNNRRQRSNLANHQVLSMDTVISNLDVESLPPTYSSVHTDSSTQSTNIIIPVPLASSVSSGPAIVTPRILFNSNIFRNNNPLKLQRRRSTTLREISRTSETPSRSSILTMATTLPRNFSHNIMHTPQSLLYTVNTNNNNNNQTQNQQRQQQRRSSSFGGSVILNELELDSLQRQFLTRSDDNLVLNASPIGESSMINLNSSDNDDENDNIIDQQTLTNSNNNSIDHQATGQIEMNSI